MYIPLAAWFDSTLHHKEGNQFSKTHPCLYRCFGLHIELNSNGSTPAKILVQH